MAIKAINNTTGPNGFIPILLIFSIYSQLSKSLLLSLLIITRAAAISKVIIKVRKIKIKR